MHKLITVTSFDFQIFFKLNGLLGVLLYNIIRTSIIITIFFFHSDSQHFGSLRGGKSHFFHLGEQMLDLLKSNFQTSVTSSMYIFFFFLTANLLLIVSVAANGLEAWKILEDPNNQTDIVLTEVVMPVLSGIGLLSKIMTHRTLKNIPVISKYHFNVFVLIFLWYVRLLFT